MTAGRVLGLLVIALNIKWGPILTVSQSWPAGLQRAAIFNFHIDSHCHHHQHHIQHHQHSLSPSPWVLVRITGTQTKPLPRLREYPDRDETKIFAFRDRDRVCHKKYFISLFAALTTILKHFPNNFPSSKQQPQKIMFRIKQKLNQTKFDLVCA